VVEVTALLAVLGAGFAAGGWLVLSGLTTDPAAGSHAEQKPPTPRRVVDLRRRAGLAIALGATTALVTRWPVAGLALGALGWFSPELFGSKAAREHATERTEAIAAWTEMLRDTISGAHGLEEAVMTTAAVAPAAIRREVTDLAVRLEREPLDRCLRQYAADLSHPTGDLVVAALTLAAEGAVGDLAELLGTLAVSARDEAGMRLRVEAARARLRTAVRVITGCTASTAIGLILLNRSYLDVYAGVTGQLVLAIVAVLWGASLWWLSRMGDFIAPERFLALAPDIDETARP
jgi:hypothetical protein